MTKRKPPTFHHLPQARAKKLKKYWVAKQKIKSKWKAQKHREGIITQRDALSRSDTLGDPLKTPQLSVISDERGTCANEAESDGHGSDSSEDGPALTATVQKHKQKLYGQEEDVTSAGSSLRELQRQAYSPATLHRYKSRSLHHATNHIATHDARIPRTSRKKDVREDNRNRSRQGGQPDMRLRMSAMLEKIRRDYS